MTNTIQLVEQHIIRRKDKRFAALDEACFHAKNIYNAANYELRQTLFAHGRRLTYTEQEKHFKQKVGVTQLGRERARGGCGSGEWHHGRCSVWNGNGRPG